MEVALGTILGAVLSFIATYFHRLLADAKVMRRSSMAIANDLRYWLNEAWGRLSDVTTYLSSDGAAGALHTKLPHFRFEQSFDHLAGMPTETSTKVFELIHSKEEANSSISGTIEFVGDEEGVDEFRGKSAQHFIEAHEIYVTLCRRVGWPVDTFKPETIDWMKREVDRLAKLKAAQSIDALDWFSELQPAKS